MASALITGRQVSTTASHLHSAAQHYNNIMVSIYNRRTAFSLCTVYASNSGITGGSALAGGGEIPPQRTQIFALPAVESGYNFWGSADSASAHIINIWEGA